MIQGYIPKKSTIKIINFKLLIYQNHKEDKIHYHNKLYKQLIYKELNKIHKRICHKQKLRKTEKKNESNNL